MKLDISKTKCILFLRQNIYLPSIYKLKLCQSPVTHTDFVQVHGVSLDSVYVTNVFKFLGSGSSLIFSF
jgi:hypothetical protein